MTRHKGAKHLTRQWPDWGPDHPIARTVAEGDHWLDAWTAQATTPWAKLAKISGIPMERIFAIARGDRVTGAELDGFARAWQVDRGQVVASLTDPLLLIE